MLDFLLSLIGCIPLDCLELRFMQRAMLGLLLLAPMTAMLGVQIVHFRMAFYSDAIGHSAFAGACIGMLLAVDPHLAMPVFGILVGLAIIALKRHTAISSDVAIGVVFSAVVAFGLAVVSRSPAVARDIEHFGPCFQAAGANQLFLIALNPVMARAHGIHTGLWQYLFAAMLALVVIFSVWAVGVLLVTALLIVPAAAARNIARSSRGMFWWAIALSVLSACLGLVLSLEDWLGTASGATIVLVATCFFALSTLPGIVRRERRG